jgi:hypothetical protein
MATINTGPTPVNTGATATTTIGPLDRAPAAVPPASDPGIPTPPSVYNQPVDRAPAPVEPGPGLGTNPGAAPAAPIPIFEVPVEEAAPAGGSASVSAATPVYIKVLSDGTVVTENTLALNFLGNGVSVAANGSTANITITAGGANYSNSNVISLMAAFGSNIISTTGNITGGYILGNGSQLTGLPATYGNANVAANLAAFGTNPISTTGNITGSYFIGNGSQLTGLAATYGNSNVAANLAAFGTNPISTTGNITGGNILGGANVNATTHTGTTVSVTGNITGNYFIGNGSQLAGIPAGGGNNAVQINVGGVLSGAAGFSYNTAANALFVPEITASGNSTTGINALYAGAPGYVVLGSSVMAQFTGNVNDYSQINFQNINNGNLSSGDYIITANNGTDSTYYLDLGLAGNNHVDPDFFGDTSSKNDGYLYVTGADQAGPAGGVGNLIVGSTNGVIKMFVGNTAQANVIATVSQSGVSVSGNVTGGNLNATGLSLSGNVVSALVSAANITTTANISGNYILGNGSQLTGVNSVTVDVTDTNGLTTIYYPTFVENRTTAQIARADVDLTYRTDDNLLTVGNVSVTGNIDGGNLRTAGQVTATGNVTGGNVTTAGLTSTASLSITGNTATVTTANYSIGYLNIPQISLAANTTTALTDSGKHYYSVSASNLALTIANNTSVAWPVGTAISIVNANTGNILINQSTGVSLYLAGNATAGNRVLSTFGMATIMNTAANVWFINGTGLT